MRPVGFLFDFHKHWPGGRSFVCGFDCHKTSWCIGLTLGRYALFLVIGMVHLKDGKVDMTRGYGDRYRPYLLRKGWIDG